MNNTRAARRPALPLSCALMFPGVVVFLFLVAIVGAAEPALYAGKLGIVKAVGLSPEERIVEGRFATYLETHTEEAVARYLEKFRNEINTDHVRELSLDYAPGGINAEDPATIVARMRWGQAVHEPASALAKELFRRALRKATPIDRRKQVVFTAGGAGAGKTTSIRKLGEISHAIDLAEIVYDTTLSTYSSAVRNIGQALGAGRMASIIYVYRDPVDALLEGVLPRAKSMGRTVPLQVILDTHLGSLEAILKIAAAYKNEPRLVIAIIDNRDGAGGATQADLEFLRKMTRKYSRESLQAALVSALEDVYEKGKNGHKNGISEALYRSIKRDAP